MTLLIKDLDNVSTHLGICVHHNVKTILDTLRWVYRKVTTFSKSFTRQPPCQFKTVVMLTKVQWPRQILSLSHASECGGLLKTCIDAVNLFHLDCADQMCPQDKPKYVIDNVTLQNVCFNSGLPATRSSLNL